MKLFSSEFIKDYNTYTFSYANYCQFEAGDQWHDIYDLGYLPYTGDLTVMENLFYMARSLRVRLELFKPSSENRRVKRKFEGIDISIELIPTSDFDLRDTVFTSFCLDYAAARFSGGNMKMDRFNYVTSRSMATHVLDFKAEDEQIAYVLCCLDDKMLHYWFSFFNLDWLDKGPIGKWIMLSAIEWAQKANLDHIYLGTCYDSKSLYKVRDFKAIEFFDGSGWNNQISTLKNWCKSDQESMRFDRFKMRENDTELA